MKKININLWIYLFFIRDEEAFVFLQQFYRPMVRHILCVQNITPQGYLLNQHDLMCVADTVLLRCLYYFRFHEKRSFSSFYRQALLNEFKDTYKKNTRFKTPDELQRVHLDSRIGEEQETYLSEFMPFEPDLTHRIVMEALEMEQYKTWMYSQLNSLQRKVFDFRLNGFRRVDICRLLQISPQRYDYAVRVIRKYLKQDKDSF